jgi:hypothetical protein
VASPDAVEPLPASRLVAGDFFADVDDADLVYLLLNVGDADCQLILLPVEIDPQGQPFRRAVVVDVGRTAKLPSLIDDLRAPPAGPPLIRAFGPGTFPVVVGTHPHDDHLRGMPEFFDRFGQEIAEYWDPGYYYPGPAYLEVMKRLEDTSRFVSYTQPTAGMTRFIGAVKIVVLSPGIGLRNRFDSYGVDPNNSSIAIKVEFPAARVEQRGADRRYLRIRRTQSIILGADSQTLSWAQVMVDFPELRQDDSPIAKQLRMALGADPLRAAVFKVSHHGSKHGISLELVELIQPAISLISSVGGGGQYRFPHLVSQEAIREGLEPTTTSGRAHKKDWELGLHYTSATDTAGATLGSVGLVLSPTGRKRHLWRFGDDVDQVVDLQAGRLFT